MKRLAHRVLVLAAIFCLEAAKEFAGKAKGENIERALKSVRELRKAT